MSNKKDEIYLNPTPIPKDKIYLNPTPIPKDKIYLTPTSTPKDDDFSIPLIPDSGLFGELSDGCQINEFGEIIREKGKSR